MRFRSLASLAISLPLLGHSIMAGPASRLSEPVLLEEAKAGVFVEDRISFSLMAGALFSHVAIGPDHPHFNYQMTNLRVGWILNTPSDDASILRGCFEAIGELSISSVFSGFGNVMIGPTFLVRYNFVQPNWKVIPYLQAGAGFVYTDAYQNGNQRAIGQAIEFTPQASAGLRYLVNDNWSINAEGIFHHVSNANMSNRNLGINGVGGLIGVTYFFDKLWQ
jgi:hypothetical protein